MDLIEARSRLTEAALRGLEDVLEQLFANPIMISGALAETPVIGGQFIATLDHSVLLPSICRAMVAKEKFRQQYPDWPPLPLREDEIEAMKDANCPRCNVVGYFGASQREASWDVRHPGFNTYVPGLMFDKLTPREIRTNPELLEEFPPKKLAGLCGGRLYWRSPERLVEDRDMQKRAAVYEAAGL